MVAPSDPGVRATQVGGFTFGKWDPHSRTLQVQAEKAGIGRIAGVLIGKIRSLSTREEKPTPVGSSLS